MRESEKQSPDFISEVKPFERFDWVLLLTAASIWGSSFFFMEIALEAEHPGLITWLRPTLGLFAVILLPSARKPIEATDWWAIVFLAFTWMAFPFTMFPIAQQWIDSSVTGMLNSAMPIMTLIIGFLIFGVTVRKVQVFGLLLGVMGISMVGLPTVNGGGTSALGVLLVLLAITSYAVSVNIAGPLQRKYGSLPVLSRVLAVSSLLTLPFGVYGMMNSTWSWKAVAANLAVGIGGTGVAYAAATTLTGRVGALRTSIVTYLIPIVASLLGVFILGERLSFWELFGGIVLLLGAWLTTRTEISLASIFKSKIS